MKHKKNGTSNKEKIKGVARKSIILLFAFCFPFFTIQAQQAIPASGGNNSGLGGSVSYTVGQVNYTTNMGINGSVAQGVQQPYEISAGIESAEGNEINLVFYAYPNPTTNFLTLEVENYLSSTLTYALYDMSGKLLDSKKIVGNETNIVMSNYPTATYFLKVFDNKKVVRTFKIIKN